MKLQLLAMVVFLLCRPTAAAYSARRQRRTLLATAKKQPHWLASPTFSSA